MRVPWTYENPACAEVGVEFFYPEVENGDRVHVLLELLRGVDDVAGVGGAGAPGGWGSGGGGGGAGVTGGAGGKGGDGFVLVAWW